MTTLPKISVLVLEGTYWLTSNTLYCLGQHKDMEVHFISRIANSPFRLSGYVRSHNYLSVENTDEEFLSFIKEVAEKTKAKILFPINILGNTFVVKYQLLIRTFINIIPLPSQESFNLAQDKGLLAEFMINNNIPTPNTIFNLTEKLEENLSGFPFPVLLKPTEGSGGVSQWGGHGITFFNDKIELLDFFSKHNITSQYIIQSFLEGFIVCCNVLYKDGHLVTYSIQKRVTSGIDKFGPSMGIEFFENEDAISLANQLLMKLKWNGLANIDLIYDIHDRKFKVLEINPRVWRTIIGSMITSKINFPVMACKLALNIPVKIAHFEVGKFIELSDYVKYNYRNFFNKKESFKYNEIDIKYFVVNLLPKLREIYNRKRETSSVNLAKAALQRK